MSEAYDRRESPPSSVHAVIREYRKSDRSWAEAYMDEEFGGARQARRGEMIDVLALPGFVAEENGRPLGIVTYRRDGNECELAFIVTFAHHPFIVTFAHHRG